MGEVLQILLIILIIMFCIFVYVYAMSMDAAWLELGLSSQLLQLL